MDSHQQIKIFDKHKAGLIPLDQVKVGMCNVTDQVVSRVYFRYTKKDYKLMNRLTIEWDDNSISTMTLENTKYYKLPYKHTFQKICNIPIGYRGRFRVDGEKGRIIRSEYITAKPTYIFTDTERLVVNNVLLKCKSSKLLRHTKYISRISRYLVDPRLMIGLRFAL